MAWPGAPEPDPAEAALLAEEVEVRLAAPADPVLRQVAVWKLEGYANGEIAAKMDRSVPTVERKLRRIRQILTAEESHRTSPTRQRQQSSWKS